LSAADFELPDGIGDGNSEGIAETTLPLHKLAHFTTAIVSSSTKQVGHLQSTVSSNKDNRQLLGKKTFNTKNSIVTTMYKLGETVISVNSPVSMSDSVSSIRCDPPFVIKAA
jgi:hypothetical protein